MNQHEFETAVVRMWATTRIPLTRANVMVFTGAPRERIEKWMNELTLAGLVEFDSDDEGEVLWRVRGAKRSVNGPRSLDEMERFQRLQREVDAESPSRPFRSAPTATRSAAPSPEPVRLASRLADEPTVRDEKSLIASGALSFVFGPLGWLYAAPLKEAVPAIVAVALVSAVLPPTLAASLLAVVSPLSAVAGVAYAYRYNQTGRRASLLELVEAARLRLPPGG